MARAFEAFGRSIKRISNYRHARDKFGEFMQPAFAELAALLARTGSLEVEVEPASLKQNGATVLLEHTREASVCFRLHRDGVRKLVFRQGLSADELLAFARVVMPEGLEGAEAGREDAVIELWKADLPHIGYEAIEVYEVARTEKDRATLQTAQERARAALEAAGGVNAADEEQHAALPLLCSPDERDSLDAGAGASRLRRAALVLLRIVEQRLAGRDLASLAEALGRLVDEMLRLGDSSALGTLLERLIALDPSGTTGLVEPLALRLAEPWRLQRVAALADGSEDMLHFGLPYYLHLLPDDAGPALLGVLATIENAIARESLASAAAARIDAAREPFELALKRGSAQVARALLAALSVIEAGQRGALAGQALTHRDLGVQAEAIKLVAANDPALAVTALAPRLNDAEPSIRLAAAAALGGVLDDGATAALLASMRGPDFARAERAEREVFYAALGRQRSQPGFSFLCEKLSQKSGANPRAAEDQLLAVRGLAAELTNRAWKVLDHASKPEAGHSPLVATACRSAARHVRETLSRGGLA